MGKGCFGKDHKPRQTNTQTEHSLEEEMRTTFHDALAERPSRTRKRAWAETAKDVVPKVVCKKEHRRALADANMHTISRSVSLLRPGEGGTATEPVYGRQTSLAPRKPFGEIIADTAHLLAVVVKDIGRFFRRRCRASGGTSCCSCLWRRVRGACILG